MNAKELFQTLVRQITLQVPETEKEATIAWLIQDRLGISRTDILSGTHVDASYSDFESFIQRINGDEPLQYILGKTEFYGRVFAVNPAVLIPRPETELLISTMLGTVERDQDYQLLDIGTGSGCIAITLALELPNATVTATDIDGGALMVARENAERYQTNVRFMQHDILQESLTAGGWDIIVSNPPYIRRSEQFMMRANVRAFEPEHALFVSDSDPLIFHRTIAQKALKAVKPGGILMMEINESLGSESAQVLFALAYTQVKLVTDLDQKNRFVIGRTPGLKA